MPFNFGNMSMGLFSFKFHYFGQHSVLSTKMKMRGERKRMESSIKRKGRQPIVSVPVLTLCDLLFDFSDLLFVDFKCYNFIN